MEEDCSIVAQIEHTAERTDGIEFGLGNENIEDVVQEGSIEFGEVGPEGEIEKVDTGEQIDGIKQVNLSNYS